VDDVAEELSAAHTETLGTRAADILHVATAAALGATLFLSFDTRQKALAAAAGLRVMP
jgi:predicted nucleic acid-binding protein